MRRLQMVGVVMVPMLVAALGLASCGGGGDSEPETKVGLKEFTVTPDPVELDAGKVEVEAENLGSETHELVVVKADSAAALPTKPDGSVDEDRIAADAKQGEIEDVAAGKEKEKTFDLEPGTYVFFCNVVEDEGGETISHFAQGMHEVVTVNRSS